jgi:hypothetical protein
MQNNKWFFSLKSGEIYEIPLEDTQYLDNWQIPLKEKPGKCNKCDGKVRTNYYITGQRFEMCNKCAKKYIDHEYIKMRNHGIPQNQ